jgi:hypothetical protein
MYDIIGDVHGYAQLLKNLLLELGYKKTRRLLPPGAEKLFLLEILSTGGHKSEKPSHNPDNGGKRKCPGHSWAITK